MYHYQLFPKAIINFRTFFCKVISRTDAHLSSAVAWREKKSKHFVFNQYFSLGLGVLKSKISKKSFEGFLRKLDFKLFHYKTTLQMFTGFYRDINVRGFQIYRFCMLSAFPAIFFAGNTMVQGCYRDNLHQSQRNHV